jgi:cytochrome c oxidase cbb3-type subunit 2
VFGCGKGVESTETMRSAGTPNASQTAYLVETGKGVYQRYCIGCHGKAGDGKGAAAEMLLVKPRDFRQGTFKFRTTPTGSLPTDEDLYRTITRGVRHTAMPAFLLLPESDRLAVIQYLKTFSDRWQRDQPQPAIFVPEPPAVVGTLDSVKAGKKIWEMSQCWQCHGKTGHGDGPASANLTDDWGNPIPAFDFTQGALKGGPGVSDIYRTFTTGLNGTPMPSYAGFLAEEDRWNLVSFTLYLMNRTTLTDDEKAAVEAYDPLAETTASATAPAK